MRSKLFVPGSRPELFAKAPAGEADSISSIRGSQACSWGWPIS